MKVTKQLADFIVNTKLEDIPPPIIQRARELFLDFIGGSLPGTRTTTGKITVDYIREIGAKPESTVIGSGLKTTAQYAAFVNATLAHIPEFEAIGLNYSLNPTSTIAVCLAMAEKLGVGGREALEGLILGHEVQGRIAAGSVASWGKRFDVFKFFHLGCAAAAAKMLKLDSDGARTAISLAVSQAAGLNVQSGTTAHYLDFRVSCRSGIESAILAQKGITAQKDIIEMPRGFCDALVGRGDYDLKLMTKDLGKTFRTAAYIKKYPCCYINHTAVDALLDLIKKHKISYQEIESVNLDTNEYALQWCQYTDPTDGAQARFSFPHVLGTAILRGKLWLEDFSDESVLHQKYREARSKVKVNVPPDWPKGREGLRFIVTLKLKNGRKLSKEADKDVKELTSEELLDRHRRLCEPYLSSQKIERSIELLGNLEKVKQIATVMEIVA